MIKKFLFILVSGIFVCLGSNFFATLAQGQKQAHKAHHGGVLNVIGKELGHIEILVQDGTLEAWFVGGGHDTDRSVPIEAAEVFLNVFIAGGKKHKLILKAAPMKLAGERIGHCSHFIAHAEWLKEAKEFEAYGEVIFKGIRQKLVIKYPEGHDPFHKRK